MVHSNQKVGQTQKEHLIAKQPQNSPL